MREVTLIVLAVASLMLLGCVALDLSTDGTRASVAMGADISREYTVARCTDLKSGG